MRPLDIRPLVSVVVPAKEEAANLPDLVDEIAAALVSEPAFEVVVVNDGSVDDTQVVLQRLGETRAWLRQVRHAEPCGQSAAIVTGVRAARGALVATLDGDGQNDPRYLPALLSHLRESGPELGLDAGQRTARQVSRRKRWASRFANRVRAALLADGTHDTGCGLKAFRRDLFLTLPTFDGMHRYLPALVLREGFAVAHLDVVDRARRHGSSNYGIFDRLMVGVLDLFGVWWLRRRRRRVPLATEVLAIHGP